MSKVTFYNHLVEMDSIIIELDKTDLSFTEKKHLITLAEKNLHNTILDAILSKLSDSDKRAFITKVTFEENERIWIFLNQKINIE